MADDLASQAVGRAFAAIARDNDRLRAITHVDPAGARARAAAIDAAATGRQLPLHGLTFVAKDLIDVAGLPTTGGSRLFEPAPAAEDAPIVSDLQAAGAVVVGKSNMHELAVGGAKNPWFGQVVNPLSPAHGTGGTSSGSVAAVAAGLVDFALGTDSGGSNRSTAAATGLYGYKPTNGVHPMGGVLPIAPTLDTVGVVARDGALLARVFGALEGKPAQEVTLEGRLIARPVGFHGPVDATVDEALAFAAEAISASGGEVTEIEFVDAVSLREAGRDVLRHEFAREYAPRIAPRRDRVGSDVRAFLETARTVTEQRYADALGLIAEHRGRWLAQLEAVDALLLPSAPGLAPRLEDEHTQVGNAWVPYGAAGAELRMWANTIGIPAVAIPVRRQGGLPASVQLAGKPHEDSFLLGMAATLGAAIAERGFPLV